MTNPKVAIAVCGEEAEYTDKVMSADGAGFQVSADGGGFQVSIAANETINTADGHTIMIISEEQLDNERIDNPLDMQVIGQHKQMIGTEVCIDLCTTYAGHRSPKTDHWY